MRSLNYPLFEFLLYDSIKGLKQGQVLIQAVPSLEFQGICIFICILEIFNWQKKVIICVYLKITCLADNYFDRQDYLSSR